jgi:CRP-like cAMP-binding protein/SAM-dependent methyltransferase
MSASPGSVTGHRLFRYLEPEEVERVLRRCSSRAVPKGELIFRSGDPGDRMYLLEAGQVEVLDDRLQEPMVLAQIAAGSCFGEIALLDGQRRTKDVRAVTACRVRELTRDDFLSWFDDEPALFAKLSRALNEVLSSRLRGTLEDDHPLIRYIRRLQRSEIRPATPPSAAERAIADERESLGQLYQAILRAKRDLFALAEGFTGVAPEVLVARGAPAVAVIMGDLFNRLEEALGEHPPLERLGQVKRLFLQEMYPCLMRSRTLDLAYLKPRGYSLDAEILERIHRDEADGDDALGILLDRFVLDQPLVAGLRRRIDAATEHLRRESAARVAAGSEEVRILCLGSGPALEAIATLAAPEGIDRATLTCVDADGEALAAVGRLATAAGVRARVCLLETDILGLVDDPDALGGNEADLVYGLTIVDRVDDDRVGALFAAAHGALRPGGSLYFAATSRQDPSRRFAELALEWFLNRRSADEMRALLAGSPFASERCRVEEDPLGVTLIAHAQMPSGSQALAC